MTAHLYDPDTDRCQCGSEWTWHEDRDTHGCADFPPPAGTTYDHMGREVGDDEPPHGTVMIGGA
jgi:hypothetical protein